jgi:P-type Cu+ transporter
MAGAWARIQVREQLRDDVESVLAGLADSGVQVMILSGDPNPRWSHIRGVVVHGGLSPLDKVAHIQALAQRAHYVLYVGDGLNDVPAIAACGAALAMPRGADLTCALSDGLLAGGRLLPLVPALRLARTVRLALRSNFVLSLAYNGVGIALAAAGLLHPVVAALIMVVSSCMVSWRAWHAAQAALN